MNTTAILKELKKQKYLKPKDRLRFLVSKYPTLSNEDIFFYFPEYKYKTLLANMTDIRAELRRNKIYGSSK